MSLLKRVTWDDLRCPAQPERSPIAQRWAHIQDYADFLEAEGEITPEAKRRALQVVSRWLLFEIVTGRIEKPSREFNRKVVRYLSKIRRKLR